MWKSSAQLDFELGRISTLPKICDLFSLRTLWRSAVYAEDYRASRDWVLELTTCAQTVLAEMEKPLGGIPEQDVRLALFLKFYHHELLVDEEKTDIERVRQILERELFEGRILLPYRFGRLLYDRYNDGYKDSRTDHLLGEDLQKLLRGAPLGVYQCGRFLSGPLGIVDSTEHRFVPPSLKLPLWHCSDTGCSALHDVRLVNPKLPALDALSIIIHGMNDQSGPPSEWASTLPWLARKNIKRPHVDLPALIGDCLIGGERTILLEKALTAESGTSLRNVLGAAPRKKRDGEGRAIDLAAKLSPEAQLQLLLTLSDKTLVEIIDDAITSKSIKIPVGETRELPYVTPRHTDDTGSQVSALGIRSVDRSPVINLISTVCRGYQKRNRNTDLDWRLRAYPARSSYESLVSFMRSQEPEDAVRDLILCSPEITASVCDELAIPLNDVRSADRPAIDRLLWKLGFYPMQFEDSILRFKSRLSEFNEAVLASTPVETEDARERVREKGVNVFVSLEHFLDRLISYNVWVLSEDHFLGTKFRYSSVDSRRSVVKQLGETLISGDTKVSWNCEEENTLGTSMRYLRATVEWIQNLPNSDRNGMERHADDLPHFADNAHLRFPFRHIALWADSDPVELQRYSDQFSKIAKFLEESEPASVRNGLDHFRQAEHFPTADKLLACVARLGQALGLADSQRFLPKVFWLFGRKGNRFGSVEYEFRDYAGHSFLAYGPALVSGLRSARYATPCILAPGNLFGSPNDTLIFSVAEKTEYSAYWQGYPRRRHIPISGEDQPPTAEQEVSTSDGSSDAASVVPATASVFPRPSPITTNDTN